ELRKGDARITQPPQGIECDKTTGMPADSNMAQLSGSFRPRQNERWRLLWAVANHEPVAVNADCRPGAAYHDNAILDDGVIRVVGPHRAPQLCFRLRRTTQ